MERGAGAIAGRSRAIAWLNAAAGLGEWGQGPPEISRTGRLGPDRGKVLRKDEARHGPIKGLPGRQALRVQILEERLGCGQPAYQCG